MRDVCVSFFGIGGYQSACLFLWGDILSGGYRMVRGQFSKESIVWLWLITMHVGVSGTYPTCLDVILQSILDTVLCYPSLYLILSI